MVDDFRAVLGAASHRLVGQLPLPSQAEIHPGRVDSSRRQDDTLSGMTPVEWAIDGPFADSAAPAGMNG